MAKIVLTFAIALLGTAVFVKKHVPAGAFVGAVLFVGIVQIITNGLYFPPAIKTACSIIAGSYLGTKVRREDLLTLKKAPFAAILMIATMIVYDFFCGWLLSLNGGLGFEEAVLGMAPGGSSELSLAAADMGYNTAAVAMLQILRTAIIVPLIPMVVKRFLIMKGHSSQSKTASPDTGLSSSSKKSVWGFLGALAIGIPAGILGKKLGIPAGTLLMSMFAVAIVNILSGKLHFPLYARYAANSCNGALIGVKLSLADMLAIGDALPLALLMDIGWIAITGILAMVFYRFTEFSLETSLFCAVPGGVSDIGLIAEDMGGNSTLVTVMQAFRVCSVIAIVPLLLHCV